MRTGALPEGNIEELINRARSYIKAYRQPPYGVEVQGTTELLKAMADKLEEYKDLEEQGKLLKLPAAIGDEIFFIFRDCPKDYKEEYCRDHEGSCENCHHRVPLRYNNDKRKKPLFSRGLSVCRHLFNSFSKLKSDEKNIEKRRLFH